MSDSVPQRSFCLRFAAGSTPQLVSTTFCAGESSVLWPADAWNATVIAFSLFFVRARIDWLINHLADDFVENCDEQKYASTLADSLEKKAGVFESIFGSTVGQAGTSPRFIGIFQPLPGDNRSGKSERPIPQKVRFNNRWLPRETVTIVIGGNDKAALKQLRALEQHLATAWLNRSRSSLLELSHGASVESPGALDASKDRPDITPPPAFTPQELDEAIRAYKEVDWEVANRYLTEYYLNHGVDVFAYPQSDGSTVRVSLLEPWKHVRNVDTTFDDRLVRPQRTSFEAKYEEIVPELRKGLGLTDPRKWNDPVFRLIKVIEKGRDLTFSFERTDFFTALVTQYCLEYELVLAMDRRRRGQTKDVALPHRNAAAGDTANILRFWETRPSRIGVSNLFLLRTGDDEYVPLLGERSKTAMTNVSKHISKTKIGQFDPPSSGILDIHSRYPKEFDSKLRHKVLTEIGEEVFGGEEWAEGLVKPYEGPLMPDWFYTKPNGEECMLELVELLQRGAAVFAVTGVCIDLMRIVPEITTLTLVKDRSYLKKYHSLFKPSGKYREHTEYTHKMRLPVNVRSFERFITKEIWSDPDNAEGKRGFDPQYYTLPGGYCLFQGLKKALEIGLR